jgi:hypothetical protein
VGDRPIRLQDANGTVYLAEPSGAFDPPDGYEWDPGDEDHEGDPKDWDRSGVFYGDESRPEGSIELYRLTVEAPGRKTDASTVLAFSPTWRPVGKVVFHQVGPHDREEVDGHTYWVMRTACGRAANRSEALDLPSPVPYEFREREWATWMRRDHAEVLGRLCERCAYAEARRG